MIYIKSPRRSELRFGLFLSALLVLLSACTPPRPLPIPPPVSIDQIIVEGVEGEPEVPALQAVPWEEVSGWDSDDLRHAFQAFLQSSKVLKGRSGWESVCAKAQSIDSKDEKAVRRFFEDLFIPHQVVNSDGTDSGLITGYYAPGLKGSRVATRRYAYPLLGVPKDLLVVDLKSLYPDLANYRLRGRLSGRNVVPYWDRQEIDGGKVPVEENVLFWVEDPVELFFLHIQGSGHIILPDGEKVLVSYADQNGHPYRSIGKLLLDRGEMTRDQMSMQNIKAWGRRNPKKVKTLLAENPSYVFFEDMGKGMKNPAGAMGVPLTPGRSLAVDRRTIPLGAPVFLATTVPRKDIPLQRLMMAQDVGGAIKGRVRADFFWGVGAKAGASAGRMKQQGRLWVLLPTELSVAGADIFAK